MLKKKKIKELISNQISTKKIIVKFLAREKHSASNMHDRLERKKFIGNNLGIR